MSETGLDLARAQQAAMAAQIKHCRDCNAEIIWLKHERTRKLAPIEADTAWGGNIEMDLGAGTYRLVKVEGRHKGHRSHFMNCPAAAQRRAHV